MMFSPFKGKERGNREGGGRSQLLDHSPVYVAFLAMSAGLREEGRAVSGRNSCEMEIRASGRREKGEQKAKF